MLRLLDLDLAGDPEADLDRDTLLDFPDLDPLPDLDLAGLREPDFDLGDLGDPDLDLADPEEADLDLDLDLLESDPESSSLSPLRCLSLLLLPILTKSLQTFFLWKNKSGY